MAVNSIPAKAHLSERWFDLALLGFVILLSVQYMTISGRRYFDFDEFQVIYASTALLRGKALYADQIENHFPLSNIIISILVSLSGFKSLTILLARYLILFINGLMLFYIYKMGAFLWDKRTGLMAVVLTLSTIVFLEKAIEIRHDVFNTLFMVAGGYYGLKYLKEKKIKALIASGLFCGLAVASTQKAVVGAIGLLFGLSLVLLRHRSYKETLKIICIYCAIMGVPLMVTLSYLMLVNDENLYRFFVDAIKKVVIGYTTTTKEMYPFPYKRFELIKDLMFQNPLFYALSIGGIFSFIIVWLRSGSEKILIAAWTLVGVIFYLTAKRPFYQSLLPTIPLLALVVGGLLRELWGVFEHTSLHRKIIFCVPVLILLLVWPLHISFARMIKDPKFHRQTTNISFCLAYLQKEDKVLCFTQNQLFFDPVLRIKDAECGRLLNFDADCFEKRMIAEQCKVIINDYRTTLLNKWIKEKIKANYIPSGAGDILIPGLAIPREGRHVKKVWIHGDYYSPTRSLMIDGQKIESNLIHLEQKEYVFTNTSNRPIMLVYIFDKKNILNQLHEKSG
jgi:hypothetical protein